MVSAIAFTDSIACNPKLCYSNFMQKPQTGQISVRWVDPRLFGIVLVPIIIFASNIVITDYMMPSKLNVSPDILQEGRDWLEAAGRYRVLASIWFFAALSVLPVAMLVRNLARPTAPETRRAAVLIWLFVFTLALLPSVQNGLNPENTQVYDRIGGALFEAVLSRGTVPGCESPDAVWVLGRCGENPVLTLFRRIIDVANVFAGLAVGALIVGMILCLDQRACKDIEEEAVLLASNLKQMRLQLYMSSLVLTFGIFFFSSWMHWPLMSVVEAEKAAYRSLVLSAGLFMGLYFSLLILSFYLPVAIILDGRVRKLAGAATGREQNEEAIDIDNWLKTHELKEGAATLIRAGFAITAPILTAWAGGISPL